MSKTLRSISLLWLALCAAPVLAADPPSPGANAVSFPQPGGKRYVVGNVPFATTHGAGTAIAVWRRNADGTPDTSFNGDGFARVPIFGVDEGASALAVQPDGRIVVAGWVYDPICDYTCEDHLAVLRLMPDGTLDPSFNGHGSVVVRITYAGGGSLQGSSGVGNEVGFSPVAVLLQDDGSVQVSAGSGPVYERYVQLRADGTVERGLTNSFGSFNAYETPRVHAQGLWYAAPAESESGWGIYFAQQGENLLATWFTYDASGKPLWLSAQMVRSAGGTYTGRTYTSRGPSYAAPTFDASRVSRRDVGVAKVTFDRDDGAVMYFVVDGGIVERTITRQVWGTLPNCTWGTLLDPAAAANVQDLWWAAPAGSESGWGLSVTQQDDVVFVVWFTYGDDGKPLWLSGVARRAPTGAYAGTLYRTTGPAFDESPWYRDLVTRTAAGTFTLSFADGNSGTFLYALGAGGPLAADSRTVAITRMVFDGAATTCR